MGWGMGEGRGRRAYLDTKTVGIARSQQPDAVVTQAIEELLEQVGFLLLALLLQHGIVAVGSILHSRQQTSESGCAVHDETVSVEQHVYDGKGPELVCRQGLKKLDVGESGSTC